MDKGDRMIYLIFFIFALFVLAGFYFTLDKISDLKTSLANLELQIQLAALNRIESNSTSTPDPLNSSAGIKLPPENPEIIIPTAIIFDIQSNPLLQPQTKITITVENATKNAAGLVKINFKAFASEADSYSAIEPRDSFELINLDLTQNQKPVQVTGQFNSIPPKSFAAGAVHFQIPPQQEKVIIQIGPSGNLKFYEFNFSKRTYKETVIG